MDNQFTYQNKKDDMPKSNIKIRPKTSSFKTLSNERKPFRINIYYYASWVTVTAFSVLSLWAIIAQEGGIDNAIKTAKFNKINRQIKNNKLIVSDNLPTASIPKSAIKINNNNDDQVTEPLNFSPYVKEQAKSSSSVIGTTYFAAFLAQAETKSAVLDLWYETKRKNPELFKSRQASYYYDKQSKTYNLVIGKFTDLNKTLQFCAELKFNDIACQYDQKFINLSTVKID